MSLPDEISAAFGLPQTSLPIPDFLGNSGGPQCKTCDGSGQDVVPMVGHTPCQDCGGTGRNPNASYEPWPDPVPIVRGKYQTRDGPMPRITTMLKVVGTATEGLVNWATNLEREACIEAATSVWMENVDGPGEFDAAMRSRLGVVRKHVQEKEKAAELGTLVHDKAHWRIKQQMGVSSPEPKLPTECLLPYQSWLQWWEGSGIKPLRAEQLVWSAELEGAGTADLICEHPEKGLGIIDLKTSKYTYDTHHLQCAFYLHAGRRWADLRWASLVRLPKDLSDKRGIAVEVKNLGHMYDRTLSVEECMTAMKSAVSLWHLLVGKGE